MCNHYKASALWRQLTGEHSETRIPARWSWSAPRVNVQSDDVYPGYIGEILMPDGDHLVPAAANWNLRPFTEKGSYAEWMKKRRGCNNAQGEKADTSWPWSMVKANRCLIPGEAFFEWDDGPVGGKTEYRFERHDGRSFFFGGLYCRSDPPEGPLLSYTMVTKPAGGDTASISHPRQPIILAGDELEAWLDPGVTVETFTQRLDPAGTFKLTPVKGPKAVAGP